MKKVLLASTALVVSAGLASAQGVELTGSAEIGLFDGGDGVEFWNDIDVTFTMSGETDGGLAFGATIDLDEVGDDGPGGDPIAAAPGNEAGVEEHSVFVSGDFGTITMGDTDGALDWAMTEVGIGSALADDHTTHAGFNGNAGLDGSLDGQIARYDHSIGDFSFAISAELADDNLVAPAAGSLQDDIFGVGIKYSGDLGGVTLGLGLGYQSGAYDGPNVFVAAAGASVLSGDYDADIVGVSLSADVSDFMFRLNYSSLDGTATANTAGAAVGGETIEWDHVGIGIGYTFDALTISANYGEFDGTHTQAGAFDASGFGVAVNYDLGGGAVIQFGYGDGDSFANAAGSANPGRDNDTVSLGLAFSF